MCGIEELAKIKAYFQANAQSNFETAAAGAAVGLSRALVIAGNFSKSSTPVPLIGGGVSPYDTATLRGLQHQDSCSHRFLAYGK